MSNDLFRQINHCLDKWANVISKDKRGKYIVVKTLNHKKNKGYYLYYKQNGKIVKITNLKKVGKNQIFSNVIPGDKIYIPPGTIIKSPGKKLSVIIR